MKSFFSILTFTTIILLFGSCNSKSSEVQSNLHEDSTNIQFGLFSQPNRFADLEVLTYQVHGFEKLNLNQKLLVYYLSEAAQSGRDIIFDQNYKHNLLIRKTLEEIYTKYSGDKNNDTFKRFEVYLKRFWFSNGIHHHYAESKIMPEFSISYFKKLIQNSPGANFPFNQNQDLKSFTEFLLPIIFDPKIDAKRVNKDEDVDNIAMSSNNFYEEVSSSEVESFYKNILSETDTTPISYGLNSKLVKENGQITEKLWKSGGMYGAAIDKMIYWLEKAIAVAETPEQKKGLELLVEYYKTGDLKKWDEYNIAWLLDKNSVIDYIHGFIEVYHDAIGMRANYESVIQIKDFEASARMQVLASNAQWFEDNSPILSQHKKKKVNGIIYNIVNVAMEAGDAAPATPIGINLPNADWLRKTHGSKSVSLGNIVEAYDKAGSESLLKEFCYSDEEYERAVKYGSLAGKMHTAMHEVIGHASGQLNPGIGTPKQTLKNYASTLEEARADLVALYYTMDEQLVKWGLIPTIEVGKAEYDAYIRNGLMTQLRRLNEGENIEEDHMRNRQLVAVWAYEKGKSKNVIEKKVKEGKTYFIINDYNALRMIFGELLKEIQRIKSEGDFKGGKNLVESYGVKVNKPLHKEVLNRVSKLNIAPYYGFVQPKYVLVEQNGQVTDVKIEYDIDFTSQMLRYSREYSFLPYKN